MRVLGLAFAGSSSTERAAMTRFVESTLDLTRVEIGGVEADVFALRDGSQFAIADVGGMGDTARSVGFLVEGLDEAIAELRLAGLEVGETSENDRHRYVHFRAPDGELYELLEQK